MRPKPRNPWTRNFIVDANGNLVAGAGTFTYDAANRLKTARVGRASASFVYDGDGKRTSKTITLSSSTTTDYLYDANASLPVLLEDGERTYVWGLGLAYAVDVSGNPIVYHADGLGSVRAITDSGGAVVQTYQYDEYGVALVSQGGCMIYDPATGRFLSRAPILPDLTSTGTTTPNRGQARNRA